MSDPADSGFLGDLLPVAASGPALPAHLYIHIPFCSSKCDYCDFASVAGASDEIVGTVFTALKAHLRAWAGTGLEGVIETVYVGGGTPSLHAERVADVLEFVSEHFAIHPSAEVTVEGNPESLTASAIHRLTSAGANRISVGVQSFDDRDLRVLGRCHDAAAAVRACDEVVAAGLALSLDLICAVPGQTPQSWSESLERAAATGAGHVSVYPLAIEEDTPLQVAVDNGLVEPVGSDDAADFMLIAEEALRLHGLERYEVANYARSDAERSRHNTAYWTGRPYLGIGPGAHSMLDGQTARILGHTAPEPGSRVRLAATRSIEGWLTGELDDVEVLTRAEAGREDIMLGMRQVKGVTATAVDRAGLEQVFRSLEKDGLVEAYGTGGALGWRTTRRGWLLGNEVFGRIWNADR